MRPARRVPRWSAERRARPKRGRMATFVRVARAGPRWARQLSTRLPALRHPSLFGAIGRAFLQREANSDANAASRERDRMSLAPGARGKSCLTLWIGKTRARLQPRERNASVRAGNSKSSPPGIAVRRTASLRSPMTRWSTVTRQGIMDCRIKSGNDEDSAVGWSSSCETHRLTSPPDDGYRFRLRLLVSFGGQVAPPILRRRTKQNGRGEPRPLPPLKHQDAALFTSASAPVRSNRR
jgi:hypothetical protein